jgi:predicted ribosome quality control (RQC) complex YloA/Tae2 family protein
MSFVINIGKNAKHNWELIDIAANDDIWFHVDSYASSHIIIHLENISSDDFIKTNKDIIRDCAIVCKAKSKAKDEKKVKIIYTTINNIKKGKGVGSVIILDSNKCKYVYI